MHASILLRPAYYEGSDPHRLVTNLIFRMGAAAMLISDKAEWADNGRAKYVLQHNHRVHAGAIDDAYK